MSDYGDDFAEDGVDDNDEVRWVSIFVRLSRRGRERGVGGGTHNGSPN